MLKIETGDMTPEEFNERPEDERLWIYNGLDAAVTIEVFHKMRPLLKGPTLQTYNFERGLLGPALDMMQRGIKVDEERKTQLLIDLVFENDHLQTLLNQLSNGIWGQDLNPRSPQQLKAFFYGFLRLPTVTTFKKGKRVESTDREALEKLEQYYTAEPFVKLIFAIRDNAKKIEVLRAGIDSDGRMRFSINVAGTETGRFSSSKNVRGTGLNGQNITEQMRRIFIPDKGFKLFYADLEQAESRAVAYIAQDPDYIAACESGDIHTFTTRLTFPHLPWTGNLKDDREIAERKFYRDFTFRDANKRIGHGSNYYGKPFTLSRITRIPIKLIEEGQAGYFRGFPGIPAWHGTVARQLLQTGVITSPTGRRRQFFDRLNTDETLRQAIAYQPQNLVAEVMNTGLWRLWKHHPWIPLFLQVHDAVLGQYPIEREDEALAAIREALDVPVYIYGRKLSIPVEIMVGYNWAKQDKKCKLFPDGNPGGLVKV